MQKSKGFFSCDLTSFLRLESNHMSSCKVWPLCDFTRFFTHSITLMNFYLKFVYFLDLMVLLYENSFLGWGQFLQSFSRGARAYLCLITRGFATLIKNSQRFIPVCMQWLEPIHTSFFEKQMAKTYIIQRLIQKKIQKIQKII